MQHVTSGGNARSTFRQQVANLLTAPLYVGASADEWRREPNENLGMLTISQEEAASLSVDEIASEVHRLVRAKYRQLLAQVSEAHPMVFYCWHDEMAGQLRFSLISRSQLPLPFGCCVRIADHLSVVVSRFLGSPWLEGIPFKSLDEAAFDEESTGLFVLDVWMCQLNSTEEPIR